MIAWAREGYGLYSKIRKCSWKPMEGVNEQGSHISQVRALQCPGLSQHFQGWGRGWGRGGTEQGLWPSQLISCQFPLTMPSSDPLASPLKIGSDIATSLNVHLAQPAVILPTGPGRPSHRMPEGPELHLASHFVNDACRELVFGGCVEKSPVSRNPEVPFESSAYSISALARGKELRLTLSPLPGAQPPREPLALVFRFGMTGSFQLVPSDALPPHAHLRFYTAPPGPRLALCFVDIRRFGRWELGGEWQPGRGPCVLLEYEQFR